MNTKTKELAYIALMTAVISVLAPISLPIVGEVPISLATLAVMLSGVLLGSRNGAAAAALYLVLGAIGVPVFAGFTSGAAGFAAGAGFVSAAGAGFTSTAGFAAAGFGAVFGFTLICCAFWGLKTAVNFFFFGAVSGAFSLFFSSDAILIPLDAGFLSD